MVYTIIQLVMHITWTWFNCKYYTWSLGRILSEFLLLFCLYSDFCCCNGGITGTWLDNVCVCGEGGGNTMYTPT